MGLISTEVEVGLCGKNITYYENLGYKIPRTKNKLGKITVKQGEKITVKTKDLFAHSAAVVDVQCDCCGKIYKVKYYTYVARNHSGQMYCADCANTVLHSGKNNRRWNDKKTDDERIIQRNYPEYKNFIKRVLARDNFTCQYCGKKGDSKLVVHHLDGYEWCAEGRTDVTNAITLCKNCHGNFHCQYGYGGNTKQQFEMWTGNTLPLLDDYNGKLPSARQIYDFEEDKVYQSTAEYCKTHKVSSVQVYDCCNRKIRNHKCKKSNGEVTYEKRRVLTVANHHLFWFDEYSQMTKEDLENYIQQSTDRKMKQVICVTTGKTFFSIKDASNFYSISQSKISNCCTGKRKTSSKINNTPLKWMYLSDYEKLSQKEKDELLIKNIEMRE